MGYFMTKNSSVAEVTFKAEIKEIENVSYQKLLQV